MLFRNRIWLLLSIASLVPLSTSLWGTPEPTDLFLRGYSVVPAPRFVKLGEQDVELDTSWGLRPGGLRSDHIAVRSLMADLESFHGLRLT